MKKIFFEKRQIPKTHETATYQLIQRRRQIERALLYKGKLSFEALKSNSGLLPDKPEVTVVDPEEIDDGVLELGRKADEIVSEGLRQEIEKHSLQPDGKTFYLIDFGLPHFPSLQSVLLDYGIDPSIYTNPSEQTLRGNAGHFRRYISTYKEHANELFTKRERLGEPKGYALLVNSHAKKDEEIDISTILPSAEWLRQRGITRVVLGKETFYHYGAPDPKNPTWRSFFEASEINRYAKQLSEKGIEVVVIGFDYRYKQTQEDTLPSTNPDELDTSYRPQAIEIYNHSVCQSLHGRRMVFDRRTGEIYKIINGFKKAPSVSEIADFSGVLLNAGLTNKEIEKIIEQIKKNLPPNQTEL